MINWKKINTYIILSLCFSWTVALVMKLLHIEISSILGTILIAAIYMTGPALATFIIQKFIYKEDFKQYGWSFNQKAWKWILFTPLIFLSLTLLTFAMVGLLGNTHLMPVFGQLDFAQEPFLNRLKDLIGSKIEIDNIKLPDLPPKLLFVAMLGQAIIGGSTINLPFMFGEEFGWRGLMLKETKKLGFLKSNAFIGLVWGIWHLPVILMGHNYPHYPYIGIVLMTLFTISVSPLFAYVRVKTKSILGACMLHGMVNASGALYFLYIANWNELYSSIAGWAGIIASVILTICIVLFDRNFVMNYKNSAWE